MLDVRKACTEAECLILLVFMYKKRRWYRTSGVFDGLVDLGILEFARSVLGWDCPNEGVTRGAGEGEPAMRIEKNPMIQGFPMQDYHRMMYTRLSVS